MKDKTEVIQDFNNLVNMTAAELEKWLKSSDSKDSGWSKDGDDGESVGHDSGRKIVRILKDNPGKTPDKYTDDQIQHMRKVVSYCKRHLAQESSANEKKSTEEVKKTKSYASLKNWGHDILKERNGATDSEDENGAGTKRASKDKQSGENKKQKTADKSSAKDESESKVSSDKSAKKGSNNDETDDETNGEDDKEDSSADEDGGKDKKKDENGGKKASSRKSADGKEPKKGDTVSWNWGQGQPEGKVKDVKHDKASIKTKRGNTVSRDGTSEDPAVIIDAGQSNAIKLAHELN